MIDPAARLETMREMFLYAMKLYSWELSSALELQFSNCPSQQFFYDMFSVSYAGSAISEQAAKDALPCIVNDSLGFVWIADGQKENGKMTALHLLGPVFTLDASENYLRLSCRRMKLSDRLTENLISQINQVPSIPFPATLSYAVMLHYCVNGEHIESGDVAFLTEAGDDATRNTWGETNWHGTWEAEKTMFRQIRDGADIDLTELSSGFVGGRVGSMCPGDPLRQAKDEVVIFSALAARAAILGGVSPEGGYNLADYYIQRTEEARNVAQAYSCCQEMFAAIQDRVRRSKEHSRYSATVASCLEYIETHICEKISLDDMASAVGYTSYYLSGKFQKETGVSVNAYIKKRKIERAKEYLDAGAGFTAADISERLSFSSPSYFSSVFRKETGMTPMEYMNRKSAGNT